MKISTFGELSIEDVFVYGSKQFKKLKRGATKGVTYNAEENRTNGDFWLFDETDQVFLIKEAIIVS